MSPACIKFFSFLSYFFLPPYAFYPSFASFRDDPSSRFFFEILLRDGGERRRKEDVLFSKGVDEIIVKNESTRSTRGVDERYIIETVCINGYHRRGRFLGSWILDSANQIYSRDPSPTRTNHRDSLLFRLSIAVPFFFSLSFQR